MRPFPLGDCPLYAKIDTLGRREWVVAQCGSENDPVFELNADTFTLLNTVGSGGVNGQNAVNVDTGDLFICPSGTSKRISPAGTLSSNSGFGCVIEQGFNAVAHRAYAPEPSGGGVVDAIVSNYGVGGTPSAVATFSVPNLGGDVGVNATTGRVYFTTNNGTNGPVAVFDGNTNTNLGIIAMPAASASPSAMFAQAVAVDSTRNMVYVVATNSNSSSNQLLAIYDCGGSCVSRDRHVDSDRHGDGYYDSDGHNDADRDHNAHDNSHRDRNTYGNRDPYHDRYSNGHRNPDGNRDCYKDSDSDSYANRYYYTDSYSDRDPDRDSHRDGDGDPDGDADRDRMRWWSLDW